MLNSMSKSVTIDNFFLLLLNCLKKPPQLTKRNIITNIFSASIHAAQSIITFLPVPPRISAKCVCCFVMSNPAVQHFHLKCVFSTGMVAILIKRLQFFKGIVHPSLIFDLLSTQPYVDEGSGGIF